MTHTRQQIIAAAQLQCASVGIEAIISPMERGYWVGGSVYVSKEDLETDESENQYHQRHDSEQSGRSGLAFTHSRQ
jgi:hypothetical protein